ncbi:hypothetical protein QUB52_18040, partial [Microcoleus sp. A6-C6]|uniref:hypothetical protein n=1 Tax=Microcoleus sp. A6-C6 TaxID=2818548 RepID=UPI002FD37208
SHKVWVKLAELAPLLIYLECVGVFMRNFGFCNITSHKVWVKLAELAPLLIYLECVGVFMQNFGFCNITLQILGKIPVFRGCRMTLKEI